MSDDKSTEDNTQKTTRRRPRTRWVLMGIAGALVMAIAGTALSTGGYSKWRGGGHDFGKYVEWRIDDMLEEVEATDDQRTQVRAIVTAAIADMGEFREFKREGRRALVEALTRETVDRAELEALRQRKLETVDAHEPAHAHRARRRSRRADARPAQGAGGGMEIARLA